MRVVAFGLQPDFNGKHFTRLALAVSTAAREVGANSQHVALADVENHVHRVELHDGGQHRRTVGIGTEYELAQRDFPLDYDAVERRGHLSVAEIDLGLPFRPLCADCRSACAEKHVARAPCRTRTAGYSAWP